MARFRLAAVTRQVGHASRNVYEVTRVNGHVLLQPLAIPHLGLAAENVNSGFMVFMHVCTGAPSRRKRKQVHAYAPGTSTLGRDTGKIGETLLAFVTVIGMNDGTGRYRRC